MGTSSLYQSPKATLIAIQDTANAFHNEFVVLLSFCAWFRLPDLTLTTDESYRIDEDSILPLVWMIIGQTFFNSISVLLVIFVPWKKGPDCWVRLAPYLYYTIIHIVYVFFPIVTWCLTIIIIFLPYHILNSLWFPCIVAYLVIQVCKLGFYFRTIRRHYLRHAIEYWYAHKQLLSD